MTATRDLYGGHMSIELPLQWKSMADLAPVPDNQEVFVCQETGHTLIVEINEPPTDCAPGHLLSFYWNEMAEANECVPGTATSQSDLSTCCDLFDMKWCKGQH